MTHGTGRAATRPATPDEIEAIRNKLDKLRSSYGVWRVGLADFLGQELCDRLHVVTRSRPGEPEVDGAEEVRAKVIWHLRRIVNGITRDEETRRAAAISFNITPYPELRTMRSLEKRVQWGNERGLCRARKAVDTRTGNMIPGLARELGKIQPVPPREEIDAIIAEFHQEEMKDGSKLVAPAAKAIMSWRKRWVLMSASASILLIGTLVAVTAVIDPSHEVERQDALHLTLTGLDNHPELATVFPRGKMEEAAQFLESYSHTGDGTAPFVERLRLGAYASWYLLIHLNLQTELQKQVTVYNIRVVDLTIDEPIDGWMFDLALGGGDPIDRMVIPINEPNPVPYAVDEHGSRTTTRFFDLEVINVAPGSKQSLIVDTQLSSDRYAGSYTFRLGFDFEVDGETYTQIVDNDGEPFRLTGRACDYEAVTVARVSDGRVVLEPWDAERLGDYVMNEDCP